MLARAVPRAAAGRGFVSALGVPAGLGPAVRPGQLPAVDLSARVLFPLDGPASRGLSGRGDARPCGCGAGGTRLAPGHELAAEPGGGASVPAPADDAPRPFAPPYLCIDRRAGRCILNTIATIFNDWVFRQAGFLPAQTVTVPTIEPSSVTSDNVVARLNSLLLVPCRTFLVELCADY